MAYRLTRKQLILDLHAAFQLAKRHKSNKPYVLHFERKLKRNIEKLADNLLSRTYKPEPSTVFIVERPKKREVFAAQFRDRVVHHLYYNYTHELFERTFVADTYSCIEGRGTHYGIERLAQHIRQESHNYQRECYVMKMDKRGYFMHIDRKILLDIVLKTLRRMKNHRIAHGHKLTWGNWIDIDFVEWLSEEIIMLDPKRHCKMVGTVDDWEGLDHSKSLFYTMDGCGLPIGNLTSQLLSNVYLNEFDQFMKRKLKCKHYGRYVDDSFVVSVDRQRLLSMVPEIREFLQDRLHLELHMGKLHIVNVRYGAEFLGGFVKPYRTYISNESLNRMTNSVAAMNMRNPHDVWSSVNSFLGVLYHYASFNIRTRMFFNSRLLTIGMYNLDMTQFTLVNP
jgi:retron-type reverse transcriptase